MGTDDVSWLRALLERRWPDAGPVVGLLASVQVRIDHLRS
jgi:hypothetical protein